MGFGPRNEAQEVTVFGLAETLLRLATSEDVYTWSVRWLNAQFDLASTKVAS
jgi:hypothetical protein